MKTWIVNGEYYHEAKSKFKRILGEYGFAYNWKEQPKYIWRRDEKHYVEGEFDREELPDGEVKRYAAKITYHGPEHPEMFELIDSWAKGHETKWRFGQKDPMKEFKKLWRASFLAERVARKAPKIWIAAMTKDFHEQLARIKEDLKTKSEIDIFDYVYRG